MTCPSYPRSTVNKLRASASFILTEIIKNRNCHHL